MVTQSGGGIPSTAHIAYATCTTGTGTPSACTATFTGGAVFTSLTYTCAVADVSGGLTTQGSSPNSVSSVTLSDSLASRVVAAWCIGYYAPNRNFTRFMFSVPVR
jgi:hypothetical protein